jgi:hypothetical protein
MDTPEPTTLWPLPTDIYCRQCRYCLRGLDSHGRRACPECGQPFDLNDPTTYLTLGTMRWSWQSIAAATCLASLVFSPALIIAGGRSLGVDRDSTDHLLVIHELILCVACVALGTAGTRRGSGKSQLLAKTVLLVFVFVVLIAAVLIPALGHY